MFASGFLDLVYGSLLSSWLLCGPVMDMWSVKLVMPSRDKIALDQ